MKTSVKIEEAAQLILGIYLFSLLSFPWWWFVLLFFTPDLGMLGYLLGDKIGAFSYNFFHHKAVGIVTFLIGIFVNSTIFQLIGLIIFAHSAFDRILGYGLKYNKGFKFTHLGEIGN